MAIYLKLCHSLFTITVGSTTPCSCTTHKGLSQLSSSPCSARGELISFVLKISPLFSAPLLSRFTVTQLNFGNRFYLPFLLCSGLPWHWNCKAFVDLAQVSDLDSGLMKRRAHTANYLKLYRQRTRVTAPSPTTPIHCGKWEKPKENVARMCSVKMQRTCKFTTSSWRRGCMKEREIAELGGRR